MTRVSRGSGYANKSTVNGRCATKSEINDDRQVDRKLRIGVSIFSRRSSEVKSLGRSGRELNAISSFLFPSFLPLRKTRTCECLQTITKTIRVDNTVARTPISLYPENWLNRNRDIANTARTKIALMTLSKNKIGDITRHMEYLWNRL